MTPPTFSPRPTLVQRLQGALWQMVGVALALTFLAAIVAVARRVIVWGLQ